MSYKCFTIAEGAEGFFIENMRFNTTRISYNFYLPLNREDMAQNALLPYLLTSCCERYKDYIQLNTRLLELYGADLSSSVAKSGDCLHIKMGISVINDEFSFDGTRPVTLAAEFMSELIFKPAVLGESFFDNDMLREKRKTVERIIGEINDKRSYARTRLLAEMMGEDAYGKFIYGEKQEVEALDGKDMYNAWMNMLSSAHIRVIVIGKALPQGIFDEIGSRLCAINRCNITDISRYISIPETDDVRVITEEFDITQGKLAIGFTSRLYGDITKSAALTLATDIFGGGPYSKLFSNVREKQSLCYYCSASARRLKGFVTVESGIEKKNAQKVLDAVLYELGQVQSGNFEDSVFEASKKAAVDSLFGYSDSSATLDVWYSKSLTEILTPQEAAAVIEKLTKDEVVAAAKGIKLHTVYRLLPSGKEGKS